MEASTVLCELIQWVVVEDKQLRYSISRSCIVIF